MAPFHRQVEVGPIPDPTGFTADGSVSRAVPKHSFLPGQAKQWCLSRRQRNKLQHTLCGNTVSARTRWESTPEAPGITLNNLEELSLPGDAAHQFLRADQVANGAVGYAMCNQLGLTPKLAVRGGSYLVLIIPGELGSDLRQQLNAASINLIGQSFCTTLTCADPATGKVFPRKVVCVNLGLQNVSAADLKPHVAVSSDESQVIVVAAFAKYNAEGWTELCECSFKETRSQVVQKIAKILNIRPVELWGLRINHEKQMLTCFVRVAKAHEVAKDKASSLCDSKLRLLFFRPFVSAASPPTVENNVSLLWSNKVTNTQDLLTICNTLKGVRGFIANQQSIGVRIEKSGIAAARAALQLPQAGIVASNANVAGTMKYIGRGFPASLSAADIVKALATAADDSTWQPWHVIPFKSQMQGDTKTCFLKADEAPNLERVVWPGGNKITFTKELSYQEAFVQNSKDRLQKKEDAKGQRREHLHAKSKEQAPIPKQPDPWA